MKKSIVLLLMSALCLLFCGCSDKPDYRPYVSQIRSAVYEGKSTSYAITAYIESREYPLRADGIAGEMKDYVILKLTFLSPENMLKNDLYAHFSLEKEYSASLSYRADVESYVANIAVEKLPIEPFAVTVVNGEQSENVDLSVAGKDSAISYRKALDVAAEYKSEMLSELITSSANLEIMIRIIKEQEDIFYYVGFVEREYTTALLVDARGNVIAEKRLKNQ